MSSNRSVRAGNTITLRARFQDDLGENAEASGVNIYLFEPDEEIDTSNPFQTGLPTYFDQGIFEYDFSVPGAGPGGTWQDVWYGTLNEQTISGVFAFEVSADGSAVALGNQLNLNNLIEVTIDSGILATDGTSMDGFSFEFMTLVTPRYSDQRKIRLEVGGYLQDVYDDTLEMAILEASIEADLLTFGIVKNTALYEHARREWVTCKSGLLLLTNLGNTSLRAKTLADLHVEYNTDAIRDSMSKLMECVNKWEGQLIAAGYALAAAQPVSVVKGACDPDRPVIGRDWYSTESIYDTNKTPAANTKAKTSSSHRRYKSLFAPKKKSW